jgi:hypothetical protein
VIVETDCLFDGLLEAEACGKGEVKAAKSRSIPTL